MKKQAKLICVFSSTLLVPLEKLVLPAALGSIFQSPIFGTTESQSQACTKCKSSEGSRLLLFGNKKKDTQENM